MSKSRAQQDPFRVLNVLFDSQLSMGAAVYELALEAGWRLKALLRTSGCLSKAELVLLFKSQVLSYLDNASLCLLHLTEAAFAPLEAVQQAFLDHIEVAAEEALLSFGLPPLSTRRDMSGLTFLYRVSTGRVPECFHELFPISKQPIHSFFPGIGQKLHKRQLVCRVEPGMPKFLRRSLFGLVSVFSSLPAEVAEVNTTKAFTNSLLRRLQKMQQASNSPSWQSLYRAS